MPQHTYAVTIEGKDYEIDSDAELTPAQAYQAAKGHNDAQAVVDKEQAARATPVTETPTAWSGFKEGAKAGLSGYIRGFVNSPLRAVTDTVSAIKNYTGGVVTDPTTGKVDITPRPAGGGLSDALHLASSNPSAFGESLGNATGQAIVGERAAHYTPLAMPPIAAKVGPVVSAVGQKGGWPIRMVGAHMLGSGNPLGVPLIAAPEMLNAAGARLTEYGAGGSPQAIRAFRGPTAPPTDASAPVVNAPAQASDVFERNWATMKPVSPAASLEQELTKRGVSADAARKAYEVPPRAPMTITPPPPTPNVSAGGRGQVEQTLTNRSVTPRTSVGDMAPSRTSGDMSATPGLSRNDVLALQMNPDIPIKSLRPYLVDQVLAARKARGMNYRDLAGLEARLRALVTKD